MPRFDVPPPEKKPPAETSTCHRICFCCAPQEDQDSEEEVYPKQLQHLKGKKNHIKMIMEAEKMFAQNQDEDEEQDSKKSWYDAFIINIAPSKRHTLL